MPFNWTIFSLLLLYSMQNSIFALEFLIYGCIIHKMNITSISIIKSVFLSAVLSLFHSNVKGNNLNTEYDKYFEDNADENDKNVVRISKQRVYNNVLKIGLRGKITMVNRHTSHASHSSHTSHYSSSGIIGDFSNHNSNSSTSRSSDNTAITQDTTKKDRSPQKAQTVVENYKLYSLGDRPLFLNLYGKDVDELVTFLIANNLLSKDHINKKNGFSVYDQDVKNAVEQFQIKARLKRIDGRFGEEEKQAYNKLISIK